MGKSKKILIVVVLIIVILFGLFIYNYDEVKEKIDFEKLGFQLFSIGDSQVIVESDFSSGGSGGGR